MAFLTVPGYEASLAPTTGGVESMTSALDSLLQLRDTCDAIFGSVVKRVDKLRSQYDDLNSRVKTLSGRVDETRQRKEAILILAAPAFPGESKVTHDRAVSQATTRSNNAFRRRKPKPVPTMDAGAASLARTAGGAGASVAKKPTAPVDPAGQFDIKILLPTREGAINRETLYRPGLGSIPRDITSVSSLTLFNTTENPYRAYSDLNIFSLSRKERTIAKERELGRDGLRDDFTTRVNDHGFGFQPVNDDDPDIMADLPEDMPLADIAMLDWDGFETPSIAPSGQPRDGTRGGRRGGGGEGDLPSMSERAGIRPSVTLVPPTIKLAATPSAGMPPPPPLPGKSGPPGAVGAAALRAADAGWQVAAAPAPAAPWQGRAAATHLQQRATAAATTPAAR
jgi:WAS family protein 1